MKVHLYKRRRSPVFSTSALIFFIAVIQVQTTRAEVVKEFYSGAVDETAPINAGGQVQTWAGQDTKIDPVTIKAAGGGAPAIVRFNTHATSPTTVPHPKPLPPPLPISPTGKTVSQGFTGEVSTVDNHKAANSSSAKVTVDPILVGASVRVREPNGNVETHIVGNAVHGKIETDAHAGVPKDNDKWHSADAFAGAEVAAARTFVKVAGGSVPAFQQIGGNLVTLQGKSIAQEGGQNGSVSGRVPDPYWLTVNDLTTGISTRMVFMHEDIAYSNADITIGNAGIHLAVGLNDPNSFALIDFSSETPWVLNPYNYSVRLDDSGLTQGGSTSLGDWVVSITGDTMNADLLFGPGGMPFDEADVMPDPALFTDGNTYTYDIGEGGGVFQLASLVPEPGSLALVLSGLALVGLRYRAILKSNSHKC